MAPVFTHKEETPQVFYFDSFDEMPDELWEWFVERMPQHVCRTLVNAERDIHGFRYELVFVERQHALEFKLRFI